MDPGLGRAAFRIAFFITLTSLVLLPFVEYGSAEFGVTLMSLVVGLSFIGIVVALIRWLPR